MQASFARFDGVLIERVFQPAADLISHRLGLDRLRIAGFCLDAASIAWIMSQAGALSASVQNWAAATSFLRAVLLLLGLAALSSLRSAFRRIGNPRGANPLRAAMLPHRGIVLALLAVRLEGIGDFAQIADLLMLVCATCALYLGACASQPPLHRQRRDLAASGAT